MSSGMVLDGGDNDLEWIVEPEQGMMSSIGPSVVEKGMSGT